MPELEERELEDTLAALYAYFAENRQMLTNIDRDARLLLRSADVYSQALAVRARAADWHAERIAPGDQQRASRHPARLLLFHVADPGRRRPRCKRGCSLVARSLTPLPLACRVSETTGSGPRRPPGLDTGRALGLSRAGVTGVSKAVRIAGKESETVMAATIDCTVDLAADQKGVHMSRFPELFDEAIDSVVFEEALLVEVLAEHIASRIVERQEALRAEVTIRALWPIRRETPVTRLATQEMVTLIGIAAASPARTRRVVGVEATGINACPCAQGLVRGRAFERLLEAGFGEDDVERILELVPIATHNQRGRGTLLVGTEEPGGRSRSRRRRGTVDERPVYELLKRPDELSSSSTHTCGRGSSRTRSASRCRRRSPRIPTSTTATSSSRARSTSRRSTTMTCSRSGPERSESCAPSSTSGAASGHPDGARRAATVLTPPETRERPSTGGGTDPARPGRHLLNDNQNTFDGVAAALSRALPSVSYERDSGSPTRSTSGQAIVWSGHASRRSSTGRSSRTPA